MKALLLFLSIGFWCNFCLGQASGKDNDLKYIKNIASGNKGGDKIERSYYLDFFESVEHRVERGYANFTLVLSADFNDFVSGLFQKIYDSNPVLSIDVG